MASHCGATGDQCCDTQPQLHPTGSVRSAIIDGTEHCFDQARRMYM
jgi:hypothetical protein